MSHPIEFDPVDRIVTGALGAPGHRRFLIQADSGPTTLTVLVEKEQVAVLSARLIQLLAELDRYYPDDQDDAAGAELHPVAEEPEPLFRARMMRLGFDVDRDLVVLELFEDVSEDLEEAELGESVPDEVGYAVRFYATRAQMRALAAGGAEAVASGRPICDLCRLPMDPDGHDCPSRN